MTSKDTVFCYSLAEFNCPDGLPVCVRDTYQDPVSKLHEHDYMEIAVVRLGHGQHTLYDHNGATLESSILKGDVYSVLSGELHSYRMCRDFRVYNLCVGWDYVEYLRPRLQSLEYYDAFLAPQREFGINLLHLSPTAFYTVEELVKKLKLFLLTKRPSRPIAVEFTLLELLYTLFDGDVKGWKHASGKVSPRITEAIAAMEAHPEEHFSVDAAAHAYGMSVSGFAHKFKDAVGVSPVEYCIMLRLESARRALEESDLSIMEIAIDNGFCDANYLARHFRKRYGMTPLDYRKIFHSNRQLGE